MFDCVLGGRNSRKKEKLGPVFGIMPKSGEEKVSWNWNPSVKGVLQLDNSTKPKDELMERNSADIVKLEERKRVRLQETWCTASKKAT